MTLTFASLAREQRSGTVHVSPEAFDEMLANTRALRQWPNAEDADGSLTFFGLVGKITVRPDPSMTGDVRRWKALDSFTQWATASGARHTTIATRVACEALAHQRCGYCGAPGQRVGTRCEYCQVAVSR